MKILLMVTLVLHLLMELMAAVALIGGPEGIDPAYMQTVNLKWSLSALTFAHPVVRVMLAEQLYRAWSINANLPYHRGE